MGKLDLSPLAVTVQAVGTLMLALMLVQLARVSGRLYARRWALAWTMFCLALVAVRLYVTTSEPLTWVVYLMLQWAFLVLLWSGCRQLVRQPDAGGPVLAYALPGAAVVASLMVFLAPSFNTLFIFEAAIVSVGAGASFRALGAAEPERRHTGWKTLRIGFAGMSLLYLAYVPLYAVDEYSHKVPFLGYSSLVDLMASLYLGYAMVLVTTDEASTDLRTALEELSVARNGLALKLNTDPLTNALNRHAFHSLQRGEDVSRDHLAGVVMMIDIDNLKRINDRDGHEAGDAVIRAAANAIRGRIRADDLLFRWGGDEFVAIIPNSTLAVVAHRMEPLATAVYAHSGDGPPIEFRLSWGGAEFDPEHPLEIAMRTADERMYQSRERNT